MTAVEPYPDVIGVFIQVCLQPVLIIVDDGLYLMVSGQIDKDHQPVIFEYFKNRRIPLLIIPPSMHFNFIFFIFECAPMLPDSIV